MTESMLAISMATILIVFGTAIRATHINRDRLIRWFEKHNIRWCVMTLTVIAPHRASVPRARKVVQTMPVHAADQTLSKVFTPVVRDDE
jgi:hypothetical protein